MFRSSHRRCSVTKGVRKNFAKFTGKPLCQSLFFNKVAELRPEKGDSGTGVFLRSATLLKKRLRRRGFPVNFAKFLITPFVTEHLRWLLLYVVEEKLEPFLLQQLKSCNLKHVKHKL